MFSFLFSENGLFSCNLAHSPDGGPRESHHQFAPAPPREDEQPQENVRGSPGEGEGESESPRHGGYVQSSPFKQRPLTTLINSPGKVLFADFA